MQKRINIIHAFTLLLWWLVSSISYAEQAFYVGAAKVDITGPIVAASTGYNSPGDELSGLGMRLYSRAFVVRGQDKIVALVTAEQLHLYQSVKLGVIKKLREKGFGDIFNEQNVLISATHTHASGSNISWYTLFNLFNGVVGFDRLHYDVVVNGISDSVIQAYHKQQPAVIKFAQGAVPQGSYNRSSLAYQKNHDADLYPNDVDSQMRLMRFDSLEGKPIGAINWYGVHTTSLSIKNTRAHGDNKGWAAYQFEKNIGSDFVAAFAQGANGDISPNMPNPEDVTLPFLRPRDLDPQLDAMENPIEAGKAQLHAALKLYAEAQPISGHQLDYRHRYFDFNHIALDTAPVQTMPWDDELNWRTCIAVVGAGFLAGVEEGGAIDYAQEGQIKHRYVYLDSHWELEKYDLADVDSQLFDLLNGVWPLVAHVLQTDKYDRCHKEKFALLPVGEVDDFWLFNPSVPFVPTVLPLQVIQLGDVVLTAVPFELTTMAWRRIRRAMDNTITATSPTVVEKHIVPVGMSNAYAMYLTTREEYAAQHFEGAFNSFGPWTQDVVAQQMSQLSQDLIQQQQTPPGPLPPDLSSLQFIETPISKNGVVTDAGQYGRVLQDVRAMYSAQYDKVEVVFRAAHPRTILELKINKPQQLQHILTSTIDIKSYSFFVIEKDVNNQWVEYLKDDDPFTMIDWHREGGRGSLSPLSSVTISWLLRGQSPGRYRVRYQGVAKEFGLFEPQYKWFEGYSSEFVIVTP